MDTISKLSHALPSIHEDDASSNVINSVERFRPTKKAIDAEISNPESDGITWEQLIDSLLEIFDSDEVNIDEVRCKTRIQTTTKIKILKKNDVHVVFPYYNQFHIG